MDGRGEIDTGITFTPKQPLAHFYPVDGAEVMTCLAPTRPNVVASFREIEFTC